MPCHAERCCFEVENVVYGWYRVPVKYCFVHIPTGLWACPEQYFTHYFRILNTKKTKFQTLFHVCNTDFKFLTCTAVVKM